MLAKTDAEYEIEALSMKNPPPSVTRWPIYLLDDEDYMLMLLKYPSLNTNFTVEDF